MTYFRELSQLCERLRELSGRKDKISLIARFLKRLEISEVKWASRLLIGRPLPESIDEELNIGYTTLMELRNAQSSLITDPPTIEEVGEYLLRIAKISGQGARERKKSMLASLIVRMTDLERRWLIKMIIGEMQHGVNEGLLLEVLSEILNTTRESIQRAYTLIGDIGEVARLALEGGRQIIESVKIMVYRPLKPMLAEECEDLEEIFRDHPSEYMAEYKVDGARVHIHIGEEGVRIFSRRLNEITQSIPDVVEQVREHVKPCRTILDGEIVAVDHNGKPLPFQMLLRRFKRIREVNNVKDIPLKLYVFDILYLDGEELIDLPYTTRWRKLENIVSPEILIPRKIVRSVEDVEEFLKSAIESGSEGIMLKRLDGRYIPGKREKLWLKIKSAETLDLVIVQADWGYGRRTGWLSNYHLAAYNPETGGYEIIGKTFKGLSDEEFEWITKKLLELKIGEEEYTVRVRPEIVVEVAYGEIQKSRKYLSGLALRFARITKFRLDKRPWEADTIQEVRRRYLKQFEKKSAYL